MARIHYEVCLPYVQAELFSYSILSDMKRPSRTIILGVLFGSMHGTSMHSIIPSSVRLVCWDIHYPNSSTRSHQNAILRYRGNFFGQVAAYIISRSFRRLLGTAWA